MVGTICFRLCNCISPLQAYPSHTITHKHVTSARVYRLSSSRGSSFHIGLSFKRSCNYHTTTCTQGNEVSYATIWHGVLPSQHQPLISVEKNNIIPSFDKDPLFSNARDHVGSHTSFTHFLGLGFPNTFYYKSIGRSNIASCLIDGSWNVAWDARPARWLHGRHSAWLSFGVCTCYSSFHIKSTPESNVKEETASLSLSIETVRVSETPQKASQGKQALKDYEVISIPGDGRCLFRAVSYGACLRMGQCAPDKVSQRELADQLRNKVVDELISRRADSEWFIEEDFDNYVKRMREHGTWGGEPELLMASHVLKMPITVYLYDENSKGLISIAEYGLEYGNENPIKVFYHGSGHYDLIKH